MDMLADVELGGMDSGIAAVIAIVSRGSANGPRRIETGIYDGCGFNFSNYISGSVERWPELPTSEWRGSYGVVDTVEQWKRLYRELVEHPTRRFAVGFTEVLRSDQPERDGWRWHKWGEYMGDHEPQCEYLYNEPRVERVLTFSIVELLP